MAMQDLIVFGPMLAADDGVNVKFRTPSNEEPAYLVRTDAATGQSIRIERVRLGNISLETIQSPRPTIIQ